MCGSFASGPDRDHKCGQTAERIAWSQPGRGRCRTKSGSTKLADNPFASKPVQSESQPGKANGKPIRGKSIERKSFPAIYSASGSDLAADGGHSVGGFRRLPAVAGVCVARGRLPHHSDAHVLSRGRPRGHGLVGHGAPRAPVRPDAGTQANDLGLLRRRLGHYPRIHLDENIDVAEQEVRRPSTAPTASSPQTCPIRPSTAR